MVTATPDPTIRELRIARKGTLNFRIPALRKKLDSDCPTLPNVDLCDWHRGLDLVFVYVEPGTWYMAAFYSEMGEHPVCEGFLRVEAERFVSVLYWEEKGEGYGLAALLDLAAHTRFSHEDGTGSIELWEHFDPELWSIAHECP